jgi:hypothetical protein
MQDSGISESDDGLMCHETSLSRVAFVLGAFSSESCCVIGLNSRQALRALNAINLYPPGGWFTGSVYDPATAQWIDEGRAGPCRDCATTMLAAGNVLAAGGVVCVPSNPYPSDQSLAQRIEYPPQQ